MGELVETLGRKARRGSKPRCHYLTHGPAHEVAARLSALAAPFATVSPSDNWMPQGFADLEEAQLHRAPRLLASELSDKLKSWWLAPASYGAPTPNFDIASTCTIDDTPGLLLIEAKAHDAELRKETVGRLIGPDSSVERKASHGQIGEAIDGARAGLEQMTSLPWKVSRDSCYQMSNRFAWAWKVAQLGTPVVLIYLGFLHADEMIDQGRPFAHPSEWDALVREQSAALFPPAVWGRKWGTLPHVIIPLIRTHVRPIDEAQS